MEKLLKFQTKPTVVDLFAGAGLLSFAFMNAGFNIIKAVELDFTAAATYAKNIRNHIQTGDIKHVAPSGLCDVIVAGPPCQGFSRLGKRQSNDPRNVLSFEVVKWASVLNPRIVVIENVVPFLASEGWQALKKKFTEKEYQVTSFVLDAKDYGLAQRRRSFTIACKQDIRIEMPNKKQQTLSVKDAWDGLSAYPNGKNHHYSPEPSELALERMKIIPPGGDKRDIMKKAPNLAPPSWWNNIGNTTDAWGRMRWDSPCNTLRTSLQNPSKGRYIHPEQHRVISLREAARLHSIPDSWSFCGSPTQIARQIGNSVPPLLGEFVAEAVFNALNQS